MSEINESNIKDFLETLCFKIKNGEENTYFKKYRNYQIKIILENNFKKSKIDYGDLIKKDRKTTCYFSQQENFVVLECVNRLLEKGYEPNKIYLEKDWKLGHKEKGRLDIQVLDKDNKSFLMIECKTFEKEFEKAESKMYEDGGQLFSYYIQDKDTKYLCLYTSVFEDFKIIYKNNIIKINENIRNSSKYIEAFDNWKPQVFEKNGIFEKDIKPYLVEFKGLKKKDLNPLSKEDGKKIFNRFAEILRRNVVSDKTNSYNKIFNLFLCKIVDECETKEEDLKFQWKENETNEDTLLRLNELYKRGMQHYLDLKISAIDIEEFRKTINNIKDENDKKEAEDLFIKQKLYSSNDFAFREVFDKNTFDLNCQVVKEVVKMLEPFKIKYETKQQFLGDFFEKLLNTGIKQEVGQFFTPVPIAQFVCKCLPIEKIIKEKIKNKEHNVLPYLIDYASGAGHFITEGMEEINNIIPSLDQNEFQNQKALKDFKNIKDDFDFAKEYVYGIEKDYRLAKTTKVATYLNGDGDANVILGDGLDNFYKSKDYKGKLKLDENKKDNENFDIVVANPPYSVSGFKNTLNYGRESFDLFENFTDKSDGIECLFIERTKQLLNSKYGVCAIVLPNSILTNSGVCEKTRELILNNFEIKGIVELGSNTFMATGTNTIILFLKKIENKEKEILHNIEKSIKEKKDLSINNIEKPISKFLKKTYKIDFNIYLDFFNNENLEIEELNKIEIYKEYIKQFKKQKGIKNLKDFVKEKEINKLKTFILTYSKKVVISNIPQDNKEEKQFLGYEFSDRRGYEGINVFELGGKLYNPNNLEDETKVNYYIYNNFLDKEIKEVDEEVTGVKVLNLNECINFKTSNFEKIIQLYEKPKLNFKENLEVMSLDEIKKDFVNGLWKGDRKPFKKIKVLTCSNFIKNNKIDFKNVEEIEVEEKKYNERKVDKNTILLEKSGGSINQPVGRVRFIEKNCLDFSYSNFMTKIIIKENIEAKYVYYLLDFLYNKREFILFFQNKGKGQIINLNFNEYKNIKIPIPTKGIQEKIIKENENLEKEEEKLNNKIEKLNNEIESELKGEKIFLNKLYEEKDLISGKRPKGGVQNINKGVISLGGEHIGYNKKLILKKIKYVPYDFYEKNKNFEVKKNDILICKDGAQTGKCCFINFEINEKMLINEHIFILRNENKYLQRYIFYYLYFNKDKISSVSKKKAQDGLNRENLLNNVEISIPQNMKIISERIEGIENQINQNEKRLEEIQKEKNKIIERYLLEE